MKTWLWIPCAAWLCSTLIAQAADVAPAAAPAKPATPASGPAVKAQGSQPGGAPAAGGSGGGVSSNGSNTGVQVGPKKPKCPDPTGSCPAEKVISK